jgi:DNA-binding GntR family transcriptional regulator
MSEQLELNPIVNKNTLIEQVYQELRRGLLSGNFKPGQRVTVRQITEIMGVSTTPVREALGRITQDGGLRYAGPKTIEVPILSQEQFKELENIRVALESTLVGSIISNSDPAFISSLNIINDEFAALRKKGRFKDALEKNMEFHFSLYERSRKPFTVNLLENVWLATGPVISLLYPKFSSEKSGVAYHADAICTIREGDADGLRKALIEDIKTGFEKIRSAMEENSVVKVEQSELEQLKR